MKPVKTRNWGAQFGDVSRLMGLKSVATADNEKRLKAEVAAHDGSHGYGRHGAQTGWEQQLIRGATKNTPDQVHDPMGVGAKIRQWNGVYSLSQLDGAPVFDLFDDHAAPPTTFASAAGNVAGGFATPEAQFLGRARGEDRAGWRSGMSSVKDSGRLPLVDGPRRWHPLRAPGRHGGARPGLGRNDAGPDRGRTVGFDRTQVRLVAQSRRAGVLAAGSDDGGSF